MREIVVIRIFSTNLHVRTKRSPLFIIKDDRGPFIYFTYYTYDDVIDIKLNKDTQIHVWTAPARSSLITAHWYDVFRREDTSPDSLVDCAYDMHWCQALLKVLLQRC